MAVNIVTIKKIYTAREGEILPDKFTSWEDEDGTRKQGHVHHTGTYYWEDGEWVPVYQLPDGRKIY